MEDLSNIWNAEDELNEDELMDYVKGKSSDDQQNALEKKMNASSFINDAVEGLQQFSSAEKINAHAQQINMQLHQQLHEKKQRRRFAAGNLSWEIIAVIIVIVLCLIGYTVIEMLRK